jgi:hypothetical protein
MPQKKNPAYNAFVARQAETSRPASRRSPRTAASRPSSGPQHPTLVPQPLSPVPDIDAIVPHASPQDRRHSSNRRRLAASVSPGLANR